MAKIKHHQSLVCDLPDNYGSLEIIPDVLNHFEQYKQTCCMSREAGGQLFVEKNGLQYKLVVATGPRKTDKRSRYNYFPDRSAERVEIQDFFDKDLFYIGDWHTHPQNIPTPSSTDEFNFEETVRQSKDGLKIFLLFIIGTSELPNGIYVCFYSKSRKKIIPSNQIKIKN